MQKPVTQVTIAPRDVVRILALIAGFVLAIYLGITLIEPLIWIIASFVLALALNPAVEFFASHLPRKSRFGAITVVFLLAALLIGFVIYSLIPPLVSQTTSLIDNGPKTIKSLQDGSSPIAELLNRFHTDKQAADTGNSVLRYFTTATGSAISVAGQVFHSVAALVTIVVITIMMLGEGPVWVRRLWELTPDHRLKHDQQIAHKMYRAVTGYVSGNLVTSAIAAITSGILMAILGVPYVISLALIVGFLDLIPLVGATIAAVLVSVIAFIHSPGDGIVMAIYFLIYQQVENHVLQPLIYGRSTQLSPLTVIVAIILGSSLAGLFGALVAIPVASCIQILLADYFTNRASAKS